MTPWVHQIYGKSEFCCAASDELETTTKLSTKTHATHLKYTQCVSTTSFPKNGTLIAFAPVKYPAAILLALCTSPNMFPVTTRIIFTHSEPSNVLHDICRNLSAPQGASHNCAYKKCLWSSRCKTHFMPQRQMKKTVLPTPSHGRSYPRFATKTYTVNDSMKGTHSILTSLDDPSSDRTDRTPNAKPGHTLQKQTILDISAISCFDRKLDKSYILWIRRLWSTEVGLGDGSTSGAGAIKWYSCQCISATRGAGVGTDVVLVAVEPQSPGGAGGVAGGW